MSKEQGCYQQRTQQSACADSNPQHAPPTYGVYNPALAGTYPVAPPPAENQINGGQGHLYTDVRSKKSVIDAYILCLTLGLVGGHHFYLKRPGWGALYILTFGLCGFGWLIDLFRLWHLVRETNRQADDPTHAHKKTISDAYTLWFPFGLFGFHHFYLNKPGFGVLYFFTLGGFGIGWLVDMCRMPSLVEAANNEVNDQEKSVGTAYVFGLPLGILGGHHFYLRRHVFGLVYFFSFGLLGIGWVVDWFRMPFLVKRTNKNIAVGDDGKKFLDDAYVLWFPLGIIGAHHFYLRRPGWGVLYLITFGLCGIGWLIDGCRMYWLVKDVNELYDQKKIQRSLRRQQRVMEQGMVNSVPGAARPENGAAWTTGQQLQYPHYPQQQQQQTRGPNPSSQQQYPHEPVVQLPGCPTIQPSQTAPSYTDQPPPYSANI